MKNNETEARQTLSDDHPVVTWLRNRRQEWEASIVSDEEKDANVEAINEALQVLTNGDS